MSDITADHLDIITITITITADYLEISPIAIIGNPEIANIQVTTEKIGNITAKRLPLSQPATSRAFRWTLSCKSHLVDDDTMVTIGHNDDDKIGDNDSDDDHCELMILLNSILRSLKPITGERATCCRWKGRGGNCWRFGFCQSAIEFSEQFYLCIWILHVISWSPLLQVWKCVKMRERILPNKSIFMEKRTLYLVCLVCASIYGNLK